MSATISPEQVNQIVYNLHHNPFEILGCHPLEENQEKWVIRAYLPKAQSAWVVPASGEEEYPMESVYHPNFFECIVDPSAISNYQLRIQEGEQERVIYDPYAFRSHQLTDFDIHLFGEGNHHRIYEKLGAHLSQVDDVKGVYFAVWAPNARNVSVIGDFNEWDGRDHQMLKRSNIIWELFIPGVRAGPREGDVRRGAGEVARAKV
jgi:1,4-alpha-glucan branching enzyme